MSKAHNVIKINKQEDQLLLKSSRSCGIVSNSQMSVWRERCLLSHKNCIFCQFPRKSKCHLICTLVLPYLTAANLMLVSHCERRSAQNAAAAPSKY